MSPSLDIFTFEVEDTLLSLNDGIRLPTDATSYPRITESSFAPLQKPQISGIASLLLCSSADSKSVEVRKMLTISLYGRLWNVLYTDVIKVKFTVGQAKKDQSGRNV